VEGLDVDDVVGDVVVERGELAVEPGQGGVLVVGESGPVRRVAQLGEEAGGSGEPDDHGRAGEQRAVLAADRDGAGGGDDQRMLASHEVAEHAVLAPVQLVLTALSDQPGDGAPGGQLELLVGVREGTVEELRQVAAGAGLARAGQADQDDMPVDGTKPRHTPRSRSRMARLVSSSARTAGERR
jgi:hypothetical protein